MSDRRCTCECQDTNIFPLGDSGIVRDKKPVQPEVWLIIAVLDRMPNHILGWAFCQAWPKGTALVYNGFWKSVAIAADFLMHTFYIHYLFNFSLLSSVALLSMNEIHIFVKLVTGFGLDIFSIFTLDLSHAVLMDWISLCIISRSAWHGTQIFKGVFIKYSPHCRQ